MSFHISLDLLSDLFLYRTDSIFDVDETGIPLKICLNNATEQCWIFIVGVHCRCFHGELYSKQCLSHDPVFVSQKNYSYELRKEVPLLIYQALSFSVVHSEGEKISTFS